MSIKGYFPDIPDFDLSLSSIPIFWIKQFNIDKYDLHILCLRKIVVFRFANLRMYQIQKIRNAVTGYSFPDK